jgi:hypothetical protein
VSTLSLRGLSLHALAPRRPYLYEFRTSGAISLIPRARRAGIAVHIGARVASLAGPGEVLVSNTVKDLVAGSGLTFEDRGKHELKGVPDRWRLYRVLSASA